MFGRRNDKSDKQNAFLYPSIKLKNVSCVRCRHQFFIKDFNNLKRESHVPLLLSCGHALCDRCVQSVAGPGCNLCRIPGTVPNEDEENAILPVNIYVLGLIGLSQSRPVCPDDPDLEFYQPIKSKIRQSLDKGRCSECLKKASARCLDCNLLFCNFCFSKLHKKALGSHSKIQLPNSENGIDPALDTNCPVHVDKLLCFYCGQCDVSGCSDCIILKHNGHTVSKLTERNEILKPEFERAYNNVAETLQRVHQAQKKLNQTLMFPGQLQNNESVEATINQHFAQLHGILQNLEKELLNSMQDQRRHLRQNLESIRLKLESHEEVLRDGLLTAASVKDYLNEIDLSNVIKKLDIMAGVPCHLIKNADESHEKIKFKVDNSVIEHLKNHCSINIPPVASFTLANNKNLPPDYNLEPLVPQDLPSPWETLFKITNISPTPSVANSIATTVTSCQSDVYFLTKGSTELVRLAHIDDPSRFYVHQITMLREIDDFHRGLEEYAMKNNNWPSEIYKNKLYVVKYEQFWYRGRVKDILKSGLDKEYYQIFYVDYGNSKVVPVQDMRNMSPLFATQSPYAIKCRLHDIVPKEEKWSREAVGAMNNMIDQKDMALTMHVHDVFVDGYSVDIVKNTTDKLTSFRDSLIFMGYGSFVTSQKLMKLNPNAMRKYFYGEFQLSKFVSVVCTHIESPESIYVVKASKNIEQMERMTTEMSKEYKRSKSKRLIMYSPEIGMACAAPLDHKSWYRGIITDIPGEKMVEVFYVDIGLRKQLFFDQIRKLQQKYMNFATQAIKIQLKDVAPLPSDRGKWNVNTINFIQSHLKEIKVRVVAFSEIENTDGFCKSYSVCLYMLDETNFNALLVGIGHAISTGVSSQCSIIQKEEEQPQNNSRKKPVSTINSAYSGSTISLSSRSEKVTDDVDPFKFRVYVLHTKSPDCIYVADPSREQVNLSLNEHMQLFYNKNSAIFEEPVKKDQMCCVYSTKDKAFFRAKVIDIKSESQVNVFFIDIGVEETVSVDDIQPLNPIFLSTPRYQFKVKLAGITPCGGSASWPSSSCQKLREIIYENESCKFFISRVGDTVDDAIPVELWVKQSKTEGPLAPTKIEMNSISRMLVLSGHAIPVKDFLQNAKRVLAVEFKRQLNKSEESLDCMSEITWSVRERYEDTIVDTDISSNSVSDVSDCDTLTESEKSEENISTETIPLPPKMAAWLKPAPIREDSFIAIPTYLDHDCFVYLHPKKRCADTLKLIESELEKRYCKAKIRSYDKVWEEGELCVAQYHNDKKWHRGVVKKVTDENNVQVEFVDYGNVEDCQIGTLKKRIILGNIPIQCTKCVIHGLYSNASDGSWSTKELDTIHTLLVEKECEVTVLDRTGTAPEILHISITLLQPVRCELITYLSEMGMRIHNPNGSCTESESPNNSVMYTTVKRANVKDDYSEIEDVVIEGYLKDCTNFPNTDIFENEEECIDLMAEKPGDVTKILPSTENKDPVLAGKFQQPGNVQTRNENSAGVASSLESLSWNDMINTESRLTSSTPQVDLSISSSQTDLSESVTEFSYKDVVDLIGKDVRKISMLIGNISRSSLTVFHGHMKDGDSEIAKMYVEQYERMADALQQIAANEPIIENPEINMPCIALYTDNQWYRGLLVKCELNPFSAKLDVKVLFVDFGNEEVVDATRLRHIDQKWMSVPAMAIKCRLYNLVPASHHPKEEMSKYMIEKLDEVLVFAKIKKRHNKTLDVELFFDEDCTYPALTDLIKEGLFKLKTKKD